MNSTFNGDLNFGEKFRTTAYLYSIMSLVVKILSEDIKSFVPFRDHESFEFETRMRVAARLRLDSATIERHRFRSSTPFNGII